ncbi:MAG: hypothetical protein M0T84_13700 [Betaproteobacteria bacterium]|nr:hypothetical protein [Betaproteobacteria bacterium]
MKQNFKLNKLSLAITSAATLATLGFSGQALAVPSYARQTGLACEACHSVFPELTAFGRTFKLNGYTLTGLRQITASDNELKINAGAPLSVMLQASVSNEGKRPPGGQNNNTEFPRQLSFFYAGEISPHMGTFIQVTNAQKDGGTGFGIDNSDVRYANHYGTDNIWGLTLNNNPSVQDVWNDSPAWGYPFIHSGEKPFDRYLPDGTTKNAPGVPDIMLDSLGQAAAGLGAYTMINNAWYAELSFYRSANMGTLVEPVAGSINGLAPYVRIAWQHNFGDIYWEIGGFGMQTQELDGNGNENVYKDLGLDSQLEIPVAGNDLLTLHARYAHETQDYGTSGAAAGASASNSSDTLKGYHLDGIYHFGHAADVALGWDDWTGTSDATLYAWGNGTTNVGGSPDTSYWTAQAEYLPWENVKLGLQYRAYTKYVGSTSSVSNDNYLMAYGWFAW